MAIVGQSYKQLKDNGVDFVTGEASYERQGRAIVLGKNKGAIEVYIERKVRNCLVQSYLPKLQNIWPIY